jgi:AraC-like DNA-binding protein
MTARGLDANTLGSVPHADGLTARLACARAKAAGIALPPLLKRANLTVQQIDDSRVRLAARDQIRLLNLIADALPDDLLGVHLAQHCDLREMGLLYYVLASSETVIEALRRAVRYAVLVNEGVLHQSIVGRQIRVAFKYVGVSRHVDRHQSEFWMVLLVRVLRQLTGVRVSARRVRLVHARQKTPDELASFFGGDIKFSAAVDEISFAGTIGSARVVSADPYLNKLLVGYYEDALTRRRPGRGSFRAMVENAIVPLLPHAEVRIGEIARQLGLGPRTLARRLNEEGLSFSALLARLRHDLADRYLAEGDTSISQIAWLLGYQEVSAFSKAYKRWTGKAPRAMRTVGPHPRIPISTRRMPS